MTEYFLPKPREIGDSWKSSYRRFMLDNFLKDDSPIGDLARDILVDRKFPRKGIRKEPIQQYLINKHAGSAALEAFEESFDLYEEELNQLEKEDSV